MDEQNTVPVRGSGKHQAEGSGKRTALLIVLLLLVLAVLGAAGYTAYGVWLSNDIFPGVQMGQTDLGGMDRAQARQALENAYGAAQVPSTLDIQVGERSFSISADDAGLTFDVAASLERAFQYGRQGSPLTRVSQFLMGLFQDVPLEPATTLDRALLQSRVAEIASAVEQTLVPSSFRLSNGTLTLDKGEPGRALNQDALLAELETKLRNADFSPTQGEITESQPQPLSAADILEKTNTPVTQTVLDLESDPTGSTIRPGTPGIQVNESALAAALLSDNRMETVPCEVTQPDYTVSEYRALLFRDILGEGTSDFNAGLVGRTTNVLLATDFCNGIILMPGQVFSYNDTVGPRTYERGFREATIYVGDSAEDGLGGGICQVSSTIYYAALRADLKIVERKCHSRMVTYVPLGQDATVAWGSVDFRFENDTDFPIKIVTSHKKSSLTVQLYGTKTQNKTVEIVTEKYDHVPFETQRILDETLAPGTEEVISNGYSGWKARTERVVYIDGVEVSRTPESTSVYRKYDKIIHYNPAAPASNPSAVPDPGQTSNPGQSSGPAGDPNYDPNMPVDPGQLNPSGGEPAQPEPTSPDGQIYLPIDPNGGILPQNP